jgi:hypothetical protein
METFFWNRNGKVEQTKTDMSFCVSQKAEKGAFPAAVPRAAALKNPFLSFCDPSKNPLSALFSDPPRKGDRT